MPHDARTQHGGGTPLIRAAAQMGAEMSDEVAIDRAEPIEETSASAAVARTIVVPLSLRARCR